MKQYFCKTSKKQLPFGILLKQCQEKGFAEAMACVVEVDGDDPLCQPLPADKYIDKTDLDERGLPKIKTRQLTPEQLEGVTLSKEVLGAKRYMAWTEPAYQASLVEGGAPLPASVVTKRAQCQAIIAANP